MTYEEFSDYIKKITSYYPFFKLEDHQLKYWFEQLSQYEAADLNKKFEMHLNGEYSKNAPTLNYLLKNLNTLTAKENKSKKYIACPFCKKLYEWPLENKNRKKCFERCSTLDYIDRMSKKYNIDSREVFSGDYRSMRLSEINAKYINFLLEVDKYSDQMTEQEKSILKTTIKSFSSQQEKLVL